MKAQVFTIILLLIFYNCSVQKKAITEEQIVYDTFIHIHFDKNESKLTNESKKTLNTIGKFILSNAKKNYTYKFEVIPSQKEKNNIEFDRVNVIINYLKDNFNIKESSLTFEFFDAIPSGFTINFSVN